MEPIFTNSSSEKLSESELTSQLVSQLGLNDIRTSLSASGSNENEKLTDEVREVYRKFEEHFSALHTSFSHLLRSSWSVEDRMWNFHFRKPDATHPLYRIRLLFDEKEKEKALGGFADRNFRRSHSEISMGKSELVRRWEMRFGKEVSFPYEYVEGHPIIFLREKDSACVWNGERMYTKADRMRLWKTLFFHLAETTVFVFIVRLAHV